jgi:GNAT superfamily N-acetyltransferase
LSDVHIEPGNIEDYEKLSRYHYRDTSAGPYAAIFAAKRGGQTIGVIVYRMPVIALELRTAATGGIFCGLGRGTLLSLLNRNVRCISRVVIDPRFRGLGLASRLVRETMPQMRVPLIEAMAVMGQVNPFFEKAGMKAYHAPLPQRCVRLTEALSAVGIEESLLIDPQAAHKKIAALAPDRAAFLELEILGFLKVYGKRCYMPAARERTKFILSKLTERPIYYIWFNPEMKMLTI